ARLGTPGSPAMLVTKGGLVFMGSGDPYLYAFDKRTGAELSRVPTEYRVQGNPVAYRSRSGRQFVVVGTGIGAEAALVAFALNNSPCRPPRPFSAAPPAARKRTRRCRRSDGRCPEARIDSLSGTCRHPSGWRDIVCRRRCR